MDTNRQQVYARPPGAPFMPMPGTMVGLPPDMAQGMPVGPMMYPYPMMMQPGMMQPGPMGMPAPPMGMSPQLTQMLAQSAQGGRGSNVFFKTRLCNKWRSGTCPFGDKCTYAHGQHELRYIPPELLAQLEREQRAQEREQRGGAPPPPPPGAPPAPDDAHPGPPGFTGDDSAAAADARAKPQLYYKTRLCIRFMQTGFCARGAACTFAHGYEDLRLLGHEGGASGPRGTPPRGGAGRGAGRQPAPTRASPAVARARALSAMAGVGEAGCEVTAAEAAEAAAAVRSGEALRATAYADSAQDFADAPPQ